MEETSKNLQKKIEVTLEIIDTISKGGSTGGEFSTNIFQNFW